MAHTTRDIPQIAKRGGTRAAAGALTCSPDGKLWSYNLLIAETRPWPTDSDPVRFVVYDERTRHSVTTSKHVGFAVAVADVVAPYTAKRTG